MTYHLSLVPADLPGSTCNILQWLLDEKPPGFITSALVLWEFLGEWLRLAEARVNYSPGVRLAKDGSSLALIHLLCGEKLLLQRYMQVASAKEAVVLVGAHHNLCGLATACLIGEPAHLPLISTPAYTALDQVAGACQSMYEERSVQQAKGSSSSSISDGSIAAAPTCSKLARLQLSPDHLPGSSTGSSADKARDKFVAVYAAGMKYLVKAWSKKQSSEGGNRSSDSGGSRRTNSSNGSSSTGVAYSSQAAALLEATIDQLDLQLVKYSEPAAGGMEQNSHLLLSAAAMQLMLEGAALLEGKAAKNIALVILRDQAARASREERSMFISNRGQLLLEVLWLAAVDKYTYQQQREQEQQQRHQRQRRAHKQVDQRKKRPHPAELLSQTVHAEPGGGQLSKEGECCY